MPATNESCELSLLVPVRNFEETLDETVRQLREGLRDHNCEILVLFDVTEPQFRDSVEQARARLAQEFGVRSFVREDDIGFGSALRFGARQAKGRALMPIMADLSDDVAAIPKMLAKVDGGADVVAGARYVEGGQIVGDTLKQRISRLYTWLMKVLTEVGCGDVSNSFKAYRREVWEAVEPRSRSFDISVELTVKAAALGYRIEEVPATWTNRQVGRSNFRTARELRNYGRWLLFAMFRMPSRWFAVAGLGLPLLVRRALR